MINTISNLISITILFWMAFWLYRDYCIDALRHELFVLRDDLFDRAMDSELSFQSDAYITLRGQINGLIRFAHTIGVLQMIVFNDLVPRPEVSFAEVFESSLKKLDGYTADRLKEIKGKVDHLILKHLLLSSPLLLVTVVSPIVSAIALKLCVQQVTDCFRKPIDKLNSAALAECGAN
ncbi:MAG: hypothetical protein EXQ58_12975 [Acidobacteria bacterium]|nr:hypothetical protein [Acidobacteriota bacterium]